jgi:hypothetical protein
MNAKNMRPGKVALALIIAGVSSSIARAQGTAFTYQGRIHDTGTPVNGVYDLRFAAYGVAGGGTPLAGPVTNSAVAVRDGFFTVTLDFGANLFTGAPRWLEVGVRSNGVEPFVDLSPRQALTASPYALFAGTSSNVASGAVVRTLNGLKDNVTLAAGANMTITPSGNTLTLSAAGGGAQWRLNGANAYFDDGRVGVGTNDPAAALEVSGWNGNTLLYATAPRPTLIFRDTFASGGARSIIGGADGDLRFYTESFWDGSNPAAQMAFTTNGMLGIGTFTPLSALHIYGRADAIRLTGAKPFLTLEDKASGLFSRIQGAEAGIRLATQGAVTGSDPSGVLALTGFGYTGVGTTSPKHKLSIAGGPHWTANAWSGAIELENSAAIAWQANANGQRFGMGHTGGGFYLFRTASDPGDNAAQAIYDFFVGDDGRVGIGTTFPGSQLDIVAQNGLRISGYQPFLTLRDSNAGYARGVIQSVSGGLYFETESYLSGANPNNYARLANSGNFSVKNLTIRGGADIAEPFELSSGDLPPGSVVVIDDEHPGKLKVSSVAYDTRVAGIVSGANGVNSGLSLQQEGELDSGQNVALSGRVYVLADAADNPIRPGDLLTTSSTVGHAMKVSDHQRAHGAILGKAMSSLAEGQGMVLVLVTLQ